MNKLVIIGAGDLGQQLAHLSKFCGFEFVGYLDDFAPIKGSIIGKISDIEKLYMDGVFNEIVIGIGYKHMSFRQELFNKYVGKVPFSTLIHPSCIIDESVAVGQGAIIYAGVTIDANCVIGENVLINVGSVIGHDSKIGANSFISPAVAIAGFVNIKACCVIGINSTIIDSVHIAQGIQIGGGTVVIESLNKGQLYVGNPARLVR